MRNLYWKAALAMVILLFASPALPQPNFCFGPTIARSVPNPVFDGDIAGDNGWLNSFLYRGGNGSPDANIILQGNSFTDGSLHQRLALGITALNDTEWDAGDSVVVLFHATGGGGTYGAIVISPLANDVAPNTPAADGRPGTSKYYTSTTGAPFTFTPSGSNAPAWVTWGSVGTAGGGACSAIQPGTNCQWTVEMGIDVTAGGLGSIDKLYVDVAEILNRTDPNGPNGSAQFSWPPGFTLSDTADVSTDLTTVNTPAVADWGTASTSSSACTGVFVGYSDISASPLDVSGNLKAGLTSTFTAKIHNSGVDANGVRVHFSHAPFGVCGLVESCFTEFGVTNTPTSCPNGAAPPNCCAGNAACIPPDPSNAGTGVQASWTPTDADDGHQCIRVKLEATQGGTTFVNMGDFHNMWVDHSSSLSVHARIDMTNVPPPEGGGAQQRVRLFSHRHTQYAYADGTVPGLAAATFTAQIITQYRAYRYTGKHITLNGVKSEVWDPVGSYAYTIQHATALAFETGFEQRHANVFDRFCGNRGVAGTTAASLGDCIARLKADMAKNPLLVQQINSLLENITEKPPVTDWTFELGGVQHIGKNADQVELPVPVNGYVMVPTKINYVGNNSEGGNSKFAVFADLGAAIPHGTFSNVVNTGFSFNGGLEYIVNLHFSAEGILGVHHFPGKIAGDVTAIQFTGGGKVYLTNSPNRVFARAGLGGYHFTSGTTNFGGYFGAGLLHEFNSHFGLEGVYTFHAVNTPGTATKFSTVQGGVRYAF